MAQTFLRHEYRDVENDVTYQIFTVEPMSARRAVEYLEQETSERVGKNAPPRGAVLKLYIAEPAT